MIVVDRFCIMGDWDQTRTPDGLLRIVMPPLGSVYGAGWQPFTQAGLRALPNILSQGQSFADVGCGSGILSVAAHLLGASRIFAMDLNPDALIAASRVFVANQVKRIQLVRGTWPPEDVDLAVISISTTFAHQNAHLSRARALMIVHDDCTVEVRR